MKCVWEIWETEREEKPVLKIYRKKHCNLEIFKKKNKKKLPNRKTVERTTKNFIQTIVTIARWENM